MAHLGEIGNSVPSVRIIWAGVIEVYREHIEVDDVHLDFGIIKVVECRNGDIDPNCQVRLEDIHCDPRRTASSRQNSSSIGSDTDGKSLVSKCFNTERNMSRKWTSEGRW